MGRSQAIQNLTKQQHDPRDPDPWYALYVDTSIPLDEGAKAAFLQDVASRSRQFLLPFVRPLSRLAMILLTIPKTIAPRSAACGLLHKMIYWGMRGFVSPPANWLIMRHFHIATEVLAFVAANTKGVEIEVDELRPEKLAELQDNVFLQHDLNVYNFIIDINRQLNEQGLEFEPVDDLDFSCITDGDFPIEDMPSGWFNFIDLESAIEIYTPMYQLLLTDSDFWRACNSLQLDETISIYATQLIGEHKFLGLVNNRHPIVPESVLGAAHRLMLHGLAVESLHAYLVELKRRTASAQATEPSGMEPFTS
tara:strand:+ start:1312 stop:2235 length:924 start_codon:yes stop_codon:yes gene_type:complete